MIYCVIDYGVVSSPKQLQTNEIQKILDKCKDSGGTVIFPKGTYLVSGLRMYSNTTIYLESGATLLGSDDCDYYPVFDVPKGLVLHTDLELIPSYHSNKQRIEYRRAMISAYGATNVSVIGEPGSVIDGQNCFDKNGEEGYRGPHGIFFSNCDDITLKGYTIQHSGNFMHQIDTSSNIKMHDVTCLGGSDGVHIHYCKHIEINRCVFRTGDDCIAGINISDLHVNNCVLNTSCNAFRIGGADILVENSHVYGPGYYPHRVTIVKSKTKVLRRDAGRHNLLSLMVFFASEKFPAKVHSHNIVFRNLIVENAGRIIDYSCGDKNKQMSGDHLRDVKFDNVRFIDLEYKAHTVAPDDELMYLWLQDVSVGYTPESNKIGILDDESKNTKLIIN